MTKGAVDRPWVLVAGAWDQGPGYPRYGGLRLGLEAAGYNVVERPLPAPWLGAAKRKPWRWCWQVPGIRKRFRSLLEGWLAGPDRPEFVLLPYPGHLLAGPAAEVAGPLGVPLVLDLFLSLRGTVVTDRRLVSEGGFVDRWLCRRDRAACEAADRVLMDTVEHAEIASAATGVPPERFRVVPVTDPQAPIEMLPFCGGLDGGEPPAFPGSAPGETVDRDAADGALRLFAFGTGVPLHGISTLLTAVAQVDGLELTLLGGRPQDREMAKQLPKGRVRLLDGWLHHQGLMGELARCHMVAGIFGTSAKARAVVPFKVVHALAAGRPVITSATPPQERLLRDRGAALWCRPGDPEDLAEALRVAVEIWRDSPGELMAMGRAARRVHERELAASALGAAVRGAVLGLVTPGSPEAMGNTPSPLASPPDRGLAPLPGPAAGPTVRTS